MSMAKVTASAVFSELSARNLRYPWSQLLNRHISPTILRLKKLANIDIAKYRAYVSLIDSLLNIARDQNIKIKLTLHIPDITALRGIDIDRLLGDKEARRDIIKRCYLPAQGRIDLRPLVYINTLYTPGLQFPAAV